MGKSSILENDNTPIVIILMYLNCVVYFYLVQISTPFCGRFVEIFAKFSH